MNLLVSVVEKVMLLEKVIDSPATLLDAMHSNEEVSELANVLTIASIGPCVTLPVCKFFHW